MKKHTYHAKKVNAINSPRQRQAGLCYPCHPCSIVNTPKVTHFKCFRD